MNRWSCAITPGNKACARHPLTRLWLFPVLVTLALSSTLAWSREDEVAERTPPELAMVATPLRRPIVGERLSFHGRWIGIPVGQGWIEVKDIVQLEGRSAYHIEAQGSSNEVLSAFYPIHDVVHSYLDTETLKPLRFEKHQREGRYRSDEIVTFDDHQRLAHYQSLLNGTTKDIPLPTEFQDLISTLYWFRTQPIEPNQRLLVDIYTDEKIYQTEISVKPPMLLELLKRGTFSCLVIEPKASFKGFLVKRGRIWAYVTADQYRVPLLVKATTPWGPMSAVIDEESLQAFLK